MTRKKAEPPPEPEQPKVDPFVAKLQQSIEDMLDEKLEPKDRNALFANAIKFLMVKHKVSDQDDGGSFFGD